MTGLVVACEGPQGPAGKDGQDGNDGLPGTAECKLCHNTTARLDAKTVQWANSKHGSGTNFERNSSACAPCHTQQGFREVVSTGAPTTAGTIKNPVGQTCKTCHFIHTNYDSTDFKIVRTDPIKLYHTSNGTPGEADLGKVGNLCGQCHQARAVAPFPKVGGSKISITSAYWGAHHSPVANVFSGNGAYAMQGDKYKSPHTQGEICKTCHMAEAYGSQAGGHTWNMTYEYHGGETANISGCLTCHSEADFPKVGGHVTFDRHGVQTEVFNDLSLIRMELANRGWLDTTTSNGLFEFDRVIASSSSPLELDPDDAGSLFNYLLLASDKSFGIHNPIYYKAILANVKQHLGL